MSSINGVGDGSPDVPVVPPVPQGHSDVPTSQGQPAQGNVQNVPSVPAQSTRGSVATPQEGLPQGNGASQKAPNQALIPPGWLVVMGLRRMENPAMNVAGQQATSNNPNIDNLIDIYA